MLNKLLSSLEEITCMKPCELLAINAIDNGLLHFHGAVEQEKELPIEILEKYKGRSGFFIKKFLIGAEYNMNQWRTPWEAIKKDVWGFEGKPVVLTPNRDHPTVKHQEDYKIGEIVEVGIDELKQIAWQVSQIFDKKAQRLIKEKKIRFGSPTVLKYSDDTLEERKLGDGRIQSTLHRFIPAHDALVAEPAYGKQVDYIPAVCDGSGEGCALKLMAVSASVNSDNTDQLTIVPFVRKVLKDNFKHKTLGEMIEFSKKTRQGDTSESCVSRKIKIIADENPEWKHDKVIAVAYSYCRKNKSAELEKSILKDLLPEVQSLQDDIRQKKEIIDKVDTFHKFMKTIKTK